MKNKNNALIIKKIKKNIASGAHGGMWKVAYADFITAMMVLFLLLWVINNAPKETLSALGDYFEPSVFTESKPKQTAPTLSTITVEGEESALLYNKLSSMIDTQSDQSIKLQKRNDSIVIVIESSSENQLFEKGKAEISPFAQQKLEYLSKVIAKLSYYITLTSHTNGFELPIDAIYTNWELSLDRVNNIRKFLMKVGLSDDRIIQLTAGSNSLPAYQDNPNMIANRRIEIALMFSDRAINPSKKNIPTRVIK